MTLATGSRLGPCEILSPLGAGGMGEVYRARDTRLERSVAVKVLETRSSGFGYRYEVSPDGKRFLVVAGLPQELSPVTLVMNWAAELRSR